MRYQLLKRVEAIFVLLMAYLIALWIFNPGDVIITSRNVLPLIITLMMIPIGKHLAESNDFLKQFENYNRILLICIPLYIIYANKVGIAGFYSDAFSTGYLITSRMYIVPIVVFLAIHYALTDKNRSWLVKMIDIGFILFNICILLINTRRTTFAMLGAAIFIYALFDRKLFIKMTVLVCFLIATLVITYPLYQQRLSAQLDKRERIQELNTYNEEGRVLETKYLIRYHEKNRNIGEVLFGVKLFDTYDFGLKYFGRDRPIHSDINMILFSTGIVGMFIFFIFFRRYFFMGNNEITPGNKILFYPLLIIFLIVLIPGRFIGTLTYPPLLMLLISNLKYDKLPAVEPNTETDEDLAMAPLPA
jgi:hypothetical protein